MKCWGGAGRGHGHAQGMIKPAADPVPCDKCMCVCAYTQILMQTVASAGGEEQGRARRNEAQAHRVI